MNKYHFNRPIIVFSDFDGTITLKDTLVFLLERFGESNWEEIEDSVKANRLSEREALQAELDTVKVELVEALSAVLKEIEIDPAFPPFVDWLNSENIPLIVLSGGFAEISRAILTREGLKNLDVRANTVEVKEGRWRVIPSPRPRIKDLCNHCKSSSVAEAKAENFFTVYIGDGFTDRCPAEKTDLIFAKDDLAEYCREQRLEYITFDNFSEVQEYLKNLVEGGA